ncbi:MAG: hypothetical protein IIA14_00935 [SAR324 cluster bacterium]|nr:hypothetical protein [SAR324 cluster bacterium]
MASIVVFEIYEGQDRTHRVTLRAGGAALDLTGATVRLVVKRRRSDVTPVFTLSNPGEIDLVVLTSGIIDINFRDDITQGRAGLYVHEINVTTAAGLLLKCSEGPLTILPSF